MLTYIRTLLETRRLARQIRRSLLTEPDKWTIEPDDEGNAIASNGKFKIELLRHRLRVLDSIYLVCGEVEVWLPLWTRLRLRGAVRLMLARLASEQWESQQKK